MSSVYVENLIMTVIDHSESDVWEDAVKEWSVVDCEEDDSCSSSCICGKENIKYLFTIQNYKNNNTLYPIGSSCIRKFEREDMNEETAIYEELFRLLHAVEGKQFLSLSPSLFSRKLLLYFYEQGVFDSEYNDYDGEEDYLFMLKMFNKRDKSSITYNQNRKIKAILLNEIRPFLQRKLANKTKEK